MKKVKMFKVKYVFIKPNTPAEKTKQQEALDEAYSILFNSFLRRKIKE